MTDYTAEQIMDGISAALRDHNMPAAASLIRMLAVKDPDAAQTILDELALARQLADLTPEQRETVKARAEAEIHRRLFGDLDNWQPTGLRNTP